MNLYNSGPLDTWASVFSPNLHCSSQPPAALRSRPLKCRVHKNGLDGVEDGETRARGTQWVDRWSGIVPSQSGEISLRCVVKFGSYIPCNPSEWRPYQMPGQKSCRYGYRIRSILRKGNLKVTDFLNNDMFVTTQPILVIYIFS